MRANCQSVQSNHLPSPAPLAMDHWQPSGHNSPAPSATSFLSGSRHRRALLPSSLTGARRRWRAWSFGTALCIGGPYISLQIPDRALAIFNKSKFYGESRAARSCQQRDEEAHHQEKGETAAGTKSSCARAPASAFFCWNAREHHSEYIKRPQIAYAIRGEACRAHALSSTCLLGFLFKAAGITHHC